MYLKSHDVFVSYFPFSLDIHLLIRNNSFSLSHRYSPATFVHNFRAPARTGD
jgi:hypothetical protein